jgi:glycosyltransferase involved in cell wall biosynthesis
LDLVSNLPPVPTNKDGKIDVAKWAYESAIPTDQFMDLGSIPNFQMPQILREMDVGLFPNRCEGGTNLVAMECMACGMPVILSSNTGHLDLIQEGNCYPLIQQNPVNRIHNLGQILTGWGESSVMEIVDQLERIYCERQLANAIGLRGAEIAAQMSWKSTAGALKRVVIG